MSIRNALATVVLALTACAPTPGPVEIVAFRPMDMDPMAMTDRCKNTTNLQVYSPSGSLDVASGRPQFLLTVQLNNEGQIAGSNITRSDGVLLDSAGRDNGVVEEVRYTYRTTPSVGAIPPFTQQTTANLNSNNTDLFWIGNLISPQAAAVLNSLTASADPYEVLTTLIVNIEFRGRLARSRAPFSTGPVPYPIAIRKSDVSGCNNLFAADPCGQAGVAYVADYVNPVACCPAMGGDCVAGPPP